MNGKGTAENRVHGSSSVCLSVGLGLKCNWNAKFYFLFLLPNDPDPRELESYRHNGGHSRL